MQFEKNRGGIGRMTEFVYACCDDDDAVNQEHRPAEEPDGHPLVQKNLLPENNIQREKNCKDDTSPEDGPFIPGIGRLPRDIGETVYEPHQFRFGARRGRQADNHRDDDADQARPQSPIDGLRHIFRIAGQCDIPEGVGIAFHPQP